MNLYLYMKKGIVLIYTANCMHLQLYIILYFLPQFQSNVFTESVINIQLYNKKIINKKERKRNQIKVYHKIQVLIFFPSEFGIRFRLLIIKSIK